MVQPHWTVWQFLIILSTCLPYNPAIPLKEDCPSQLKLMFTQKPVCDFIYSCFIHNYSRKKQPKCPIVREWKNKLQNLYSVECYSAIIKMKWISHTLNNMNESEMHNANEISQTHKAAYCMIPLPQRSSF